MSMTDETIKKTYFVSKENIRRVKYAAADQEKSESDVVNEILTRYFAEKA